MYLLCLYLSTWIYKSELSRYRSLNAKFSCLSGTVSTNIWIQSIGFSSRNWTWNLLISWASKIYVCSSATCRPVNKGTVIYKMYCYATHLATKQLLFKTAELEIQLCAWRHREFLASIVDSVFEQSLVCHGNFGPAKKLVRGTKIPGIMVRPDHFPLKNLVRTWNNGLSIVRAQCLITIVIYEKHTIQRCR